MPSRNCQAGDTVFVRALVLEAASDAFQVVVDDGSHISVTVWVPSRECARREDLDQLRPVRRASRWHIDR